MQLQWRQVTRRSQDQGRRGGLSGLRPHQRHWTGDSAEVTPVWRGWKRWNLSETDPERLLEVKGITESKLEDIKTSYAESRMLQDLNELSPHSSRAKTGLKCYKHFGPASVDILKKVPLSCARYPVLDLSQVVPSVGKTAAFCMTPCGVKAATFSVETARAAKDVCSCQVKLWGERRLFGCSMQRSPPVSPTSRAGGCGCASGHDPSWRGGIRQR